MKNDKYLKFILTVIAICLLWICVRDMKVGPSSLFAREKEGAADAVDVRIVGTTLTAFLMAEPIKVEVANPDAIKPAN